MSIPGRPAERPAGEQLNAEGSRASPFEAWFEGDPVESAPDALVIVDAAGRIVLVSERTERMFGYLSSELLGQPVEVLVPERFRANHPSHRAAYLEDLQSRSMGLGLELAGLRSDGTEFPVDIYLAPVRSEQGRLAAAFVRDLTETQHAERALQRQARRLRTLHSIDRGILGAGSLEDIARAALLRIRELIHCHRATIWLTDLDAGEAVLFVADLNGETHLAIGSRTHLDPNPILERLRSGEPFVTEDLSTIPELPSTLETLRSEGLRAFMSLPMITEGELVGTLSLSSREAGAFTAEDVEVGREVADQLAIAFVQSRLRDSERRRAVELQELVDDLGRTDAQRRELMARLVRAQEEERQRIAADLHDDTIQHMTALGIRLAAIRRSMPDDPVLLETLAQLEESVSASIERLRHLLFELHPRVLDHPGGLRTALRETLQQLAGDTGISVGFDENVAEELSPEARAVCYRITLEALANVRKHAQAAKVEVRVESRDGGMFVRIRDDGVGFAPEGVPSDLPGHVGLASMRERADAAGGWLRLDSDPGKGTTVEFWVPGSP